MRLSASGTTFDEDKIAEKTQAEQHKELAKTGLHQMHLVLWLGDAALLNTCAMNRQESACRKWPCNNVETSLHTNNGKTTINVSKRELYKVTEPPTDRCNIAASRNQEISAARHGTIGKVCGNSHNVLSCRLAHWSGRSADRWTMRAVWLWYLLELAFGA